MARPPEPKLFQFLKELIKTGKLKSFCNDLLTTEELRMCHGCTKFLSDGKCKEYGAEPPPEFLETFGQCGGWEDDDIPF